MLADMETEHIHLQKLADAEIYEVLDRAGHGHLACHNWRETYVVPVTFVRDGDYIYSHSLVGKKIKMMRSHPQVCLQAEEIESFFNWRSVVLWGRFEELSGIEAATGMRLLTQKIAQMESQRGLSAMEVEISAILNQSVIYRIRIEKMTGRSEGRKPTHEQRSSSEKHPNHK